jgi:hypothetical protein
VLGGDAGGALALGQAASTAIFGLMALKGFRAELSPCPYAGKSAENAQEGARGAFCGRGRGKPLVGRLGELDPPPRGLGYDIL